MSPFTAMKTSLRARFIVGVSAMLVPLVAVGAVTLIAINRMTTE